MGGIARQANCSRGQSASNRGIPRDPKDAPFLAAAVAFDAEFLITGDKDLLEASDIVKTRIVTVAEFSEEFHVS